MSSKLKIIITLFVLIQVFVDLRIVCQSYGGSDDCFGYCSYRWGMRGKLFPSCVIQCHTYEKESHNPPIKRQSNRGGRVPRSNLDNREDSEESDTILKASAKSVAQPSATKSRAKPQVSKKPKILEKQKVFIPSFKTVLQPNHCGLESPDDIVKKEVSTQKTLGKFMGGMDADPYEFPWIASIQFKNKNVSTNHFCGGSIITKNYILTAAHCMDGFIGKEKSLVIKIGLNSYSQSSAQNLIVMGIILHEGWDPTTLVHDIALIRVKPDIKFSTTNGGKYKVNALCLPTSASELVKGEGLVAGWGQQVFKSGVNSEWLQKVTVPIVDKSKCKTAYSKFLRQKAPESKVVVTDQNLCAGGAVNKDSCRGDSGGSLIQIRGRTRILFGVVSFTVNCTVKDLPTLYTNVVPYMEWINKSVNKIKSNHLH